MKMQKIKSIIASFVCIVLIAAMALCITGCEKKGVEVKPFSADATVCGEGKTAFNFSVIDKDGNQTDFFVKTDKTVVGEALLENGLISGENSEYGLYVKVVNGIALDFNTDGMYWAFYVNGDYATSGVDMTEIDNSAHYVFKAEK
jgi:hypothetical protein